MNARLSVGLPASLQVSGLPIIVFDVMYIKLFLHDDLDLIPYPLFTSYMMDVSAGPWDQCCLTDFFLQADSHPHEVFMVLIFFHLYIL